MTLPSDIAAKIENDFPQDEVAPVIEMLTELRLESPEIFGDRITRCVVFIGNGSFAAFVKAVELARLDWRDLIVEAEYDGCSGEENRRRNLNKPFEI